MILEKEKFLKLIEKSIPKFLITIQGDYSENNKVFTSDTLIDLSQKTKILIIYKDVQFTIEKLRSTDKEFIVKTPINDITIDFKITDIEFEDLSILIQKEFEKRQIDYQIEVKTKQHKTLKNWEKEILN